MKQFTVNWMVLPRSTWNTATGESQRYDSDLLSSIGYLAWKGFTRLKFENLAGRLQNSRSTGLQKRRCSTWNLEPLRGPVDEGR